MRESSDQVLAKRLIKIRDQGGIRLSTFLRMNFKKYVFILGYFSVALAVLAVIGWWPGFALVLGMVLGTLLRDLAWVSSTQWTWPFTVKATDWDLVAELAAEKVPDPISRT
jgi:hypothetical protein